MIYDKNQFIFNILLVLIFCASVALNIYYSQNFKDLEERYLSVNETLAKVESNQNYNFIQGAHNEIEYLLTPQGFTVVSANDFGVFNGPSMQPSIYDRNLLIERKYANETLEEGQIIRFMRNGEAVIHRVRADYGDKVFVQGDSLKEGEMIAKDRVTHIIIGVLFS
jgi:hypothetical protein